MDSKLSARLTRLAKQIVRLERAELLSLTLDANEKIIFSQLLLKAFGSSIAIKEANVYASKSWQDFVKAQIDAKVDYNKCKRHYALLDQAYLAEHLTYKLEANAIRRGVE